MSVENELILEPVGIGDMTAKAVTGDEAYTPLGWSFEEVTDETKLNK